MLVQFWKGLDPSQVQHWAMPFTRARRYMLCAAGAVYVERRPVSAPKEDRAPAEPLMFSSQGSLQADKPAAEQGMLTWGVYSCAQSVDGFIAYLNPQGQRESALKRVRLSSSCMNGHVTGYLVPS